MTFAIGEHDFLLHGEPFRILSGAIHYFRVHPDHWADRIRKARQMGLNTIETYVAWNAHAPREGEFDLSGNLDLGAFLDVVAAEGMYAIVRPGPYICAEWTNGGLPAWLFSDSSTGVRQDEPRYMSEVDRYLEQLAPVLVPRQIDQRRADHPGAGRERVRRVRRRQDVPPQARRDQPEDRHHGAADHGRPAGRRHARERRHPGAAPDRIVRLPGARTARHACAGTSRPDR